mmetsp:Transcript_24921/g.41055  ORF Transcript_24921/g.41055 Transcript_24921/m.41055 type:complete len:543 (-) Transcript_24921:630-2258(-)
MLNSQKSFPQLTSRSSEAPLYVKSSLLRRPSSSPAFRPSSSSVPNVDVFCPLSLVENEGDHHSLLNAALSEDQDLAEIGELLSAHASSISAFLKKCSQGQLFWSKWTMFARLVQRQHALRIRAIERYLHQESSQIFDQARVLGNEEATVEHKTAMAGAKQSNEMEIRKLKDRQEGELRDIRMRHQISLETVRKELARVKAELEAQKAATAKAHGATDRCLADYEREVDSHKHTQTIIADIENKGMQLTEQLSRSGRQCVAKDQTITLLQRELQTLRGRLKLLAQEKDILERTGDGYSGVTQRLVELEDRLKVQEKCIAEQQAELRHLRISEAALTEKCMALETEMSETRSRCESLVQTTLEARKAETALLSSQLTAKTQEALQMEKELLQIRGSYNKQIADLTAQVSTLTGDLERTRRKLDDTVLAAANERKNLTMIADNERITRVKGQIDHNVAIERSKEELAAAEKRNKALVAEQMQLRASVQSTTRDLMLVRETLNKSKMSEEMLRSEQTQHDGRIDGYIGQILQLQAELEKEKKKNAA